MGSEFKVAVLGTGQMGSGIIRLLLNKRDVVLAGVYGRRPQRAGVDVGRSLGLDALGLEISNDLPALLNRFEPNVVIQATCSEIHDAEPEIRQSLEHGAHVISIAEEMAYPAYRAPDIAQQLDRLAKANGVTLLGTGINPGFVLDVLVVTLTGVCHKIDRIRGTRVNDLSPYGPSVLFTQGVGLTPEAFDEGVRNGTVSGHIGFPESMSLVARALGWQIDRIEQTREPIVSRVSRETPFVKIEPGLTAGCLHKAKAYQGEKAVIELIHPQQIRPDAENVETGDKIQIWGEPNLTFSSSPEIPGGIGTVALAVNMIPLVVEASPGLKTMIDLPVPRAITS